MQIPSKKECFELICDMEMMDHIVRHSLQVCRVATLLTDRLASEHIILNRDLIQASARLHDITKTRSFITKENHALTGSQLLSDKGYTEVGHIIGQHVQLNAFDEFGALTEAEIVSYADKRVLHDQVVSLEKRMRYIVDKYGVNPMRRERIRYHWKQTERLEEKIFSRLPFSPQTLPSHLDPDDFDRDLSAYNRICNGQEARSIDE